MHCNVDIDQSVNSEFVDVILGHQELFLPWAGYKRAVDDIGHNGHPWTW